MSWSLRWKLAVKLVPESHLKAQTPDRTHEVDPHKQKASKDIEAGQLWLIKKILHGFDVL